MSTDRRPILSFGKDPIRPGPPGRGRLPWTRAIPIVVALSLLGWVLVVGFLVLVS